LETFGEVREHGIGANRAAGHRVLIGYGGRQRPTLSGT
jgi:hypothetical protein